MKTNTKSLAIIIIEQEKEIKELRSTLKPYWTNTRI